jgi:hypothetical protein
LADLVESLQLVNIELDADFVMIIFILFSGTHFPSQPQPGARLDPEREAGAAEHHQLILRPAHRVPHLRVPLDDLLRRHEQAGEQRK